MPEKVLQLSLTITEGLRVIQALNRNGDFDLVRQVMESWSQAPLPFGVAEFIEVAANKLKETDRGPQRTLESAQPGR